MTKDELSDINSLIQAVVDRNIELVKDQQTLAYAEQKLNNYLYQLTKEEVK